jgi:hypothetical protein
MTFFRDIRFLAAGRTTAPILLFPLCFSSGANQNGMRRSVASLDRRAEPAPLVSTSGENRRERRSG